LPGAAVGAVISASHNPFSDNGIKFFGPDGRKLADTIETEIERALAGWEGAPRPDGAGVGRVLAGESEPALAAYAEHLRASCPARLDGLRLVVDCANGAASFLAPQVLSDLGADVTLLSATPDGININDDCGSLHPEHMAAAFAKPAPTPGLAFDGDADRVILADERGRIVDGDRVLCLAGIHLAAQDRLPGRTVVGTDYSNLGLEQAFARHDIRLLRAKTGDRYVAEQMAKTGAVLGGEKSGHILFAHHSTTGDGILTALQVLQICRESGRGLADWADEMRELPQVLVNVRVRTKESWRDVPAVQHAIAHAESVLAGRGRIFVRPSGTEKMIRVMVEGPDQAEVESLAASVANTLREQLGVA
jgi:phosphoglucosamine mutase